MEPPTKKQLAYAAKLGIGVSSSTSKTDVSALISEAERANPNLVQKREQAKQSRREKTYGPELIEVERKWNQMSEDLRFILIAYRKGKETVVDVLDCAGAEINKSGNVVLQASVPKIVKDRHIGQYLEWDKSITIPIENIRYYEYLNPNFHEEEIGEYRKAVERGLSIVRRFKD